MELRHQTRRLPDEQSERHHGRISTQCAQCDYGCQRFGKVIFGQRHSLSCTQTPFGRGVRCAGRIYSPWRRLAADQTCGVCRPESYWQKHAFQPGHIRKGLRCHPQSFCRTAVVQAVGLYFTVFLVQCRRGKMRRVQGSRCHYC